MATAYDLALIGTSYFIAKGKSPLRPITPQAADQFAFNTYRLILAMPSDPQAGNKLINYLNQVCNYYGADLVDVVRWLNKAPQFAATYIQYCQENFRLETNGEIVRRKISEAFGWVGETVAGALWGAIKPLLPLVILSITAIVVFNKATAKK